MFVGGEESDCNIMIEGLSGGVVTVVSGKPDGAVDKVMVKGIFFHE